jgi:hypothetical protein
MANKEKKLTPAEQMAQDEYELEQYKKRVAPVSPDDLKAYKEFKNIIGRKQEDKKKWKAKGGPVKKYANGGSVRAARF